MFEKKIKKNLSKSRIYLGNFIVQKDIFQNNILLLFLVALKVIFYELKYSWILKKKKIHD